MPHIDRSSFDTGEKLKSVLLNLVTKKTQKIEPIIMFAVFSQRKKSSTFVWKRFFIVRYKYYFVSIEPTDVRGESISIASAYFNAQNT